MLQHLATWWPIAWFILRDFFFTQSTIHYCISGQRHSSTQKASIYKQVLPKSKSKLIPDELIKGQETGRLKARSGTSVLSVVFRQDACAIDKHCWKYCFNNWLNGENLQIFNVVDMQLLRYLFAVKERRKQSICEESRKAKRDEEGTLLTVLGVASPLALVLPMCILHGLVGFLNVSAIVVWRKQRN